MMPIPEQPPTSESRLRAALWFAERGFGVFSVWSTNPDGSCRCGNPRCESPGKHPIPVNGLKSATTEPERIAAMLSVPSNPNWGMLPPEGVFVLDVDGEGVNRLAELEQLHGSLPPTLRTNTAHGQHIFLRWPNDMPRPIGHLFGFVTRWGSGRDTGYVIGPRSVHSSGVEYAPASDDLEIAQLPERWAQAAVNKPKALIQVTSGGYQLPERVWAHESRYEAIRSYTAHLYATSRLDTAEMWPLVRDLLAPRFEQPLTEPELRSRFERAVDKMPERLGERRAAPPEPVDPATFPIPENRGQARLSELGMVEYVDDLIRPGRIVVWAAEEGSGKSFTVSGELAIRMAVAGGEFAQTWPILKQGRVLVMSEMHPDDDYLREDIVLQSLGHDRRSLDGCYYRLDLMTAAGGQPALTVAEWRSWITEWLHEQGVILMVVDTATGATQVDPWGREIQAVYSSLRVMLAEYPQLAVVLIVHLKKPQGGERGISDVLGEWGRWCDVVVLQENEGLDLERTKITVRKRVRRERRVTAAKRGGLLVDAIDVPDGMAHAKVSTEEFLEAVRQAPGSGAAELAKVLKVSQDTIRNYVDALSDLIRVEAGPNRKRLYYLAGVEGSEVSHSTLGDTEANEAAESAQVSKSKHSEPASSTPDADQGRGVEVEPPPYGGRGGEVRHSTPTPDPGASKPACATCRSAPTGTYPDGSPRFGCGPHSPISTEASA